MTAGGSGPSGGIFHGWKILGVVILTQALASGMFVYGFGVLQVPIAEEFGVSRAAVAWGLSGAMALGAVVAPLMGRAFDLHSIRMIMLGSAVTTTGCYLAMAAAGPLALVIVLYALGSAIGIQGIGNLAASKLVSNWFIARRGRALGFAAMGTSVGGFVAPPLLAEAVARWGWRGAVACGAAAIGLLAAGPILLLVRNAPGDLGLAPDGQALDATPDADPPASQDVRVELLRDRAFWVLTGVVSVLLSTSGALIANLPPIAYEIGMAETPAAALLSIMSVAAILGKLVFGIAAERVDKRWLLALALALLAAFMLLLQAGPTRTTLTLGVALPGLALGGVLPLWGAVIADYWGAAGLGRAMGTMAPFSTGLQIASIQFLPWCFDRYGSYQPGFGFFLGLLAAALVAVAALPPARGETSD
jgi:sugar phosphate permease